MATDKFKASVQYNDLKGSSAADRADINHAQKWLTDEGHCEEGEYLVGLKAYIGEYLEEDTPVLVDFLIDTSGQNINIMSGAEDDPINLKKIHLEFSVLDFFRLFKRFEITLSTDEDLENKHYSFDG